MNIYNYSFTFNNTVAKKKKKSFLLVKADNVMSAQNIAENYVQTQKEEKYMVSLILTDVQYSM